MPTYSGPPAYAAPPSYSWAPVGSGPVMLAQASDGVAVVPSPDPLTRLHFFDGRLLAADDLIVEQNAERALAMFLAQAGGSGVAWGLDVDRDGETLAVSPGLAFDPSGRPLLLPDAVTLSIAALLGAGTATPVEDMVGSAGFAPCTIDQPAGNTVEPTAGSAFWLLTIGWIEGYCGTMDVYGSACEQACIGGTDRPYRVDGVVFRLRPYVPASPLPSSSAVLFGAVHLRCRVASVYFADERAAAVPMSAASLASPAWCHGGAAPLGAEVPLALLARTGDSTAWLDEWIARRERVEPPARIAFDARLAMRSRAAWSAQLAQFQCQLADRLAAGGLPAGTRRLITAGFESLPPSGYLAVQAGVDVVVQVGAMTGEGLDLRFVPMPVDAIAHEIESVQHRDRISLTAGLDDPSRKPAVDILVPGGQSAAPQVSGIGFDLGLELTNDRQQTSLDFTGAARYVTSGGALTLTGAGVSGARTNDGATGFLDALGADANAREAKDFTVRRPDGSAEAPTMDALREAAKRVSAFVRAKWAGQDAKLETPKYGTNAKPIAGWASIGVDVDPWSLTGTDQAYVHGALDIFTPAGDGSSVSIDLSGQLTVDAGSPSGAAETRAMRLRGVLSISAGAAAPHYVTLDLPATVTRSDSGDGVQFAVTTSDGVTRTLSIGGSPLAVSMDLGMNDTVDLAQDQDALSPPSTAYQTADLALQMLQAARPTDPQFYQRARALTFGDSSGGGSGATAMVADRDWVAFRRRAPEAPATVATAPSAVQIWLHAASTPQDADSAQHTVQVGSAGKLGWNRVGTGLFDAQTGALQTAAATLVAGYTAAGGGSLLQYVDFTPQDLPGAGTRSGAVLGALGAVATPVPGHVPQSADVPDALVDPDTDGSLLLISSEPAPVETTSLQVLAFVIEPKNEQEHEMVESITSARPDRTLLNQLIPEVVKEFGPIDIVGTVPDASAITTTVAAVYESVAGTWFGDEFPRVLVDKDWAGTHAEQLDAIYRAAGEVVAGLAKRAGRPATPVGHFPVKLGIDPTPAILVLGFAGKS